MSDQNASTSTGVSTSDGILATSPVPGSQMPVSPAQTPSIPATTPAGDTSALINSYESRLRALMSEKDKAINERNQAIAKQMELQQQLTQLQEQTSSSLTAAAGSAQAAIDENTRLKAQMSQLQGELLRYTTLRAHPELLDYAEFLPATSDETAMQTALAKLLDVRKRDMERNGRVQVPSFQPTGSNAAATTGATSASVPGTQPPHIDPMALYANRGTLAPGIGSSPAMMNPNGAASSVDAIAQMLSEARASGDPAVFQAAVEKASLLAQQDIHRTLGVAR